MASNNLASIAAATAAGWKLNRPVAQGGKFVTELMLNAQGQPGNSGQEIKQVGESNVSQAAADTVALNAINAWRSNRYGSDSAGVNVGTVSTGAATPSSQGLPVTLQSLTKDKH